MRNTLRHSDAGHMLLRLRLTADSVTFEVSDDGRGFDAGTQEPEGHFGLRVLGDLAREHGGRLEIAAQPGHGTSVRLAVPVA